MRPDIAERFADRKMYYLDGKTRGAINGPVDPDLAVASDVAAGTTARIRNGNVRLRGPVWSKKDEARRAAALAENRSPPELGLIVYKDKRVATMKRAFRRIGTELGLMGFSQYSLRHFMAEPNKEAVPRNVPREQRSLWMGHVVRDGSRTTFAFQCLRIGYQIAMNCRWQLDHHRHRLFIVSSSYLWATHFVHLR